MIKLSRRAESRPPPRPSQARIGTGLRAMFDEVTASPLPDRLAELTQKLEEALEKGELSRKRS